jgi:hypothetical protein
MAKRKNEDAQEPAEEGSGKITIFPNKRYLFGRGDEQIVYEIGKAYDVTEEELAKFSKNDYSFEGDEKK